MVRSWRQHGTTILVAMVTAAVTAGGPVLAAAVREGLNADQVDSKDAVGAGASAAARAGNLVATNAGGRLPNNIISKAPNADRLDGLDSTRFLRTNGTAANSSLLDGVDSAELRFITLDPHGAGRTANVTTTHSAGAGGGLTVSDTHPSYFSFGITLPPDYTSGSELTVRLVWNTAATACNVILLPNFVSVSRPGQTNISGGGATTGMSGGGTIAAGDVAQAAHETLFTLTTPDSEIPLQPGDGYIFGIFRSTGDTCTGNVNVQSVSVTY